MPDTAKFDLRYPSSTDGANVPLDMQELAEDIENNALPKSGTLAARPTPNAAYIGVTYYATDTAQLFVWTGSSWIELPIVGSGDVTADTLAAALATLLGISQSTTIRRGKSIITAEESRTATNYGLLSTPDSVNNVALPTDGVIAVLYEALWKESVNNTARASIFIGSDQLKISGTGGGSPQAKEASINGGAGAVSVYQRLVSGKGLGSTFDSVAHTSSVSTGQIIGLPANVDFGGICYIHAAAGSYNVSVQFKASSGTVTVKERKLWVWVMGF